MDLDDLIFFKERFEMLKLQMVEAKDLLGVVETAISNFEKMEENGHYFHAFYYEVWGLLTEIGDSVDSKYIKEIKAMEAEFAGHTLFYRLSEGWLIREENAPLDFASFGAVLSVH